MMMVVLLPFLVGGAARFAVDDMTVLPGWVGPLSFLGIAVWCIALVGVLPKPAALPVAVVGGVVAGLAFLRAAPNARRPDDDDGSVTPAVRAAVPQASKLDWLYFDQLREQWEESRDRP
jgi:hypothetical protein